MNTAHETWEWVDFKEVINCHCQWRKVYFLSLDSSLSLTCCSHVKPYKLCNSTVPNCLKVGSVGGFRWCRSHITNFCWYTHPSCSNLASPCGWFGCHITQKHPQSWPSVVVWAGVESQETGFFLSGFDWGMKMKLFLCVFFLCRSSFLSYGMTCKYLIILILYLKATRVTLSYLKSFMSTTLESNWQYSVKHV